MAEQARRGFLPTDTRDFGEAACVTLRKEAEEVFFLLNRGYPVQASTRFVGDRYQFSERQRLALARAVSPADSVRARLAREVTDLRGKVIDIDGFNVIIGLEIAFSHSMLFRCMDRTVRDLAGLHGTYRLIPQTDLAVGALLRTLSARGAAGAVIHLDRPVSNSGRLRARILAIAEEQGFIPEVCIEDAVDTVLKSKPLTASGDAIILDECAAWYNLAADVIAQEIGDYPYIDITSQIKL